MANNRNYLINPLLDRDFLQELDLYPHKFLWAKITALNWEEYPVEEITGKISSGSINVDGSSAVRRTCSLSLVTSMPTEDTINNILINDLYWSVHSKFSLMVGVENKINDEYPEIIWFNQGKFVISSFSASLNTNSYSISIQGKDKMSMLNGDIGGVIPASWDFGKESITLADGSIQTNYIPIKEIIRQAVHEFAQEEWQNIIVNDLDDYGLELLGYIGEEPAYYIIEVNSSSENSSEVKQITLDGSMLCYDENDNEYTLNSLQESQLYDLHGTLTEEISKIKNEKKFKLTLEEDANWYLIAKITRDNANSVCGYRMCDIVYPGDLIASPGETVTSILDKIVQMLGSFEYYYDVDGKFIFQRKKVYSDVSYNNLIGEHSIGADVWAENAVVSSKYGYSFENNVLVSAIQNSPNLSNLKNDYSLWGMRKSGDISVPIHLRYAIDHKPFYYKTYAGDVYITKEGKEYFNSLPDDEISIEKIDKTWFNYKEVDWREIIYQMANDYRRYYRLDDFLIQIKDNNKYNDYISLYPRGFTGYEKYYIDFEMNLSQGVLAYWRELYNPEAINGEGENKSGRYLKNGTFELDDSLSLWEMIENEEEKGYEKDARVKVLLENVISQYEKIYNSKFEELNEWKNEEYQKIWVKYKDDTVGQINAETELLDKFEERLEELKKIYLTDLIKLFEENNNCLIYRSIADNNKTVPGAINSDWVMSFGDYTYDSNGWNPDILNNPEKLNFWFDFLDTTGVLNKFSVQNIGQRTKSVNDDKIKAITFKDIPSVIFNVRGEAVSEDDWLKPGYTTISIPKSYFNYLFQISSRGKCALDVVEEYLYNYTYPASSVTLTVVPIYYLIPNTLIYVNDKNTGVFGEYILEKYSIQLGLNSQMTINAIESPRRLY